MQSFHQLHQAAADKHRIRMWVFICLSILGLKSGQTTGQDFSTQMHYFTLLADSSTIPNITEILNKFESKQSLKVSDVKVSTACQRALDQHLCTCQSGYKWSDQVCKAHPDCCGEEKCSLNELNDMCVSDQTVTIKGSLMMKEERFVDCLEKGNSRCNNELITELKTVYSTLKGFDNLNIISFSFGMIAEFEITVAYSLDMGHLIQRTETLIKLLPATFDLNTRGVVQMIMPPNPVHYHSKQIIRCSVKHDMYFSPGWWLQTETRIKLIESGTESTVQDNTTGTIVSLSLVSELWAGEYICNLTQESASYRIVHSASQVLDVCLLPNIEISTSPSFPHCQNDSDILSVQIRCDVDKSKESYSVVWTGEVDNSTNVYTWTLIHCNQNRDTGPFTCTFTNRCKQTRSASTYIRPIHANDHFCPAEGDWESTKVSETVRLKCKNQAGMRLRTCTESLTGGNWEAEVSECVSKEVNDLQHQAIIVDIGLGSARENTASVFSRLQTFTNNTNTLNTFANMNASVNIMSTMSHKQPPHEDRVVDDFLGSSSNLLDESMSPSWDSNVGDSNTSLAERYLRAVENLIHMTNISQMFEKKNIQVAARNCSQKSQCINKVFNDTVHLKGINPGSVKTASFKALEKYLPNDPNLTYTPNSNVVTTTTENELAESVQVKIHFRLLMPRPRNVEMMCAFWDNKTRGWSDYKCKWRWEEGSVCVCEHLSSFAILMAKAPLKVSGINEVTYIGLSVSIASLIISLVIEMIVWKAVVKTNTLYLRHVVHINICLCLLVADVCFLASSEPAALLPIWCQTLTVMKHFCFLSMFFWMLSLSSILLHKAVFMFHNVSKKSYLRFSIFLGYICPLLIVTITFLTNNGGTEGSYYSKESCWLVYVSLFKGSIHTFVIPVGIVVLFNLFSMLVVILKLLDNPYKAETAINKEKMAISAVIRAVILLTPIFGVTWIFGFAVMLLDLTQGRMVYVIHYVFVILNAFQGLYILLTTWLGDPMVREELLRRVRRRGPASTTDSTSDSTLKK